MGTRTLLLALRGTSGIALLAFIAPVLSTVCAQDPPPPPLPDPNGAAAGQADPNVEVMTRGPVHEAFAVPVTAGQTTGMIVPKQPANPVEEVPPDMKPEGDNSVWIPGYWSWDDDRKDFVWVSGVWRVPPPGYRWMPGYWQDVAGQGFQWISGYWMPAQVEETTFMPQPPQSIEAGPTSNAPDENHFWVPGNWQWRETRYAWQPGYWSVCRPDWIWVPATYYWCPRGWVHVPGYWDYPLARRGLVFSPVYFRGPVVAYRPAICLDVGVFSFSLFCRPSYCHYYFGDYYDDRYVALGIRPWFYYNSPRHGYDPLYGYYRWYHVDRLGERQWDQHLRGWHEYYRGHPDMRPPHTLAAQRTLLASQAALSRPDIQQLRLAHDIHQVSKRPEAFVKLQPVSQVQRAQLQQAALQTNRFEAERRQFEKKPIGGMASGPTQPEKVSLTKIPSFKSNQLPGAAASNINPFTSRPNGANAANISASGTAAAGAVTGRKVVNPGTTTTGRANPDAGRISRPGGVSSTGAASGGASTAGSTGRPTLNPGTVSPGGTSPATGAVNPGALNPLRGNPATGNPGGSNPGSGKPAGRERDKKPQASVPSPVGSATTATFTPPAGANRKADRLGATNTLSSGAAVTKPQPQPLPSPKSWNVMRPDSGNAGGSPARSVGPASSPQARPSNTPSTHTDSRADDKRVRDKDKK